MAVACRTSERGVVFGVDVSSPGVGRSGSGCGGFKVVLLPSPGPRHAPAGVIASPLPIRRSRVGSSDGKAPSASAAVLGDEVGAGSGGTAERAGVVASARVSPRVGNAGPPPVSG